MAIAGNPIYQALVLPDEAFNKGGIEILRAALIDDELYVTAMKAFKDPATWGEVLADMARRIALLYSAEDTSLTEKQILVAIEQAFAADLGAPLVKAARRTAAKRKEKPPARKPGRRPARAAKRGKR